MNLSIRLEADSSLNRVTSSNILRRIATLCVAITLFANIAFGFASEPTKLTPEGLWELGRVGEATISPDGNLLAYVVTRYELAANEGKAEVHIVPFQKNIPTEPLKDAKKGVGFGTPQLALQDDEIILGPAKGIGSLNWVKRPDGLRLVYEAAGEGANTDSQAWSFNPATKEKKQLTTIEGGIGNLKVSPTGKHLAFTRDVKLDKTVQDVYADLPKADARIIDSLMYRHWNAWHDYAYSHLCTATWSDDGTVGEPKDLMKDLRADCPMPPFGGSEQFNFSPDGKQLAFTMKMVDRPAESTDSSVYLVDVTGGEHLNVCPTNPGYDNEPIFSPDGAYLAYLSMARPTFEADRNRIMIYERSSKNTFELTKGLDQTCHNIRWNHDSKSIYFDSETKGMQHVYSISLSDGKVAVKASGMFDFHVLQAFPNREGVLVSQQCTLRPVELAVVTDTLGTATFTGVNDDFFSKLALPKVEERWVKATDGEQIHNWVVLPPNFDPQKTYPMLVFCQGGPQGQVGQWFSYRWNFHTMASQGYVVLGINRRGLPGFGQAWNDEISGDWGGQAMKDILSATDSMLTESYVDAKRVAAIGASFGGYTVYWLMGNAEDRFRAMIAHCGVFNLESMYGSTEEMFFVNYDLGGPYWKSQASQAKYNLFSPHRFAGNWKTPLLVIHGEKDFRVPVTQGMEAFTVAQTQGVPSRFLYFPGEGHWITKPQNSVLWYRVFFDWLGQHLKE